MWGWGRYGDQFVFVLISIDQEDEPSKSPENPLYNTTIGLPQDGLKLTEGNLKILDSKNKVSLYVDIQNGNLSQSFYGTNMSQLDLQNHIMRGPKLSEIPGMSAGRMFKLTEFFSKSMGNSLNLTKANPLVYNDMFYSLWQSSIGGSSLYNFSTTQTTQLPKASGLESKPTKVPNTEVKKKLSFSQLSNAGSDDYRKDIEQNQDFLKDFRRDKSGFSSN